VLIEFPKCNEEANDCVKKFDKKDTYLYYKTSRDASILVDTAGRTRDWLLQSIVCKRDTKPRTTK
jgi:hypothetical protein